MGLRNRIFTIEVSIFTSFFFIMTFLRNDKMPTKVLILSKDGLPTPLPGMEVKKLDTVD